MPAAFSGFGFFFLVITAVLALKSFGINQEYRRGVVFRLGRLQETKGPGWFWLIPLIERVVKIDLRVITFSLATQETVTRDGVAARINPVLWFRPVDAAKVVTTVMDWTSAVIQAAETGLRDAIDQSELDLILKDRTSINASLLEILDKTASQCCAGDRRSSRRTGTAALADAERDRGRA
jgi:regulator of protease activity HflC (stomatin/prohibitin superfamily)